MGLDIWFQKRQVRTSEVAYFRKVNFLVQYFENRGYTVENCKELAISKEDVEELIHRCEEVLADPTTAKDLLPTQDGFFYGSTDYDEYYYDDVKDVLEKMKALLPMFDDLEENEKIEFVIWY